MPLSQAIVEYSNYPEIGDSNEKTHYRNLGEPAQDGPYDPKSPYFYKFTPKEPWYRESAQNEYKKQFYEHLCSQLEIGNLIAIGIPELPIEKENPEFISEKLFMQFHLNPNYEHWDNDIFWCAGGKYRNVRIYDPRFNLDGSPKKNTFSDKKLIQPVSEENTGGRPGTDKIILKAYAECQKLNLLDFDGKQYEAIEVIQEYIRNEMPDIWNGGKGFHQKTMSKYIGKAFTAEKAKRKNL